MVVGAQRVVVDRINYESDSTRQESENQTATAANLPRALLAAAAAAAEIEWELGLQLCSGEKYSQAHCYLAMADDDYAPVRRMIYCGSSARLLITRGNEK